MGDIPVKYNEAFWKNLSIPPETKFYQKNARDLASIYGVPLDEQFQLDKLKMAIVECYKELTQSW